MRRRIVSGAATALLCVAFLVVGGCGDGARKHEQLDVAALNAALALREGELSERLAALAPGKVTEARQSVREKLDQAVRTMAELPEDNASSMVALASTLARFRTNVTPLQTQVGAAAKADAAARLETAKACNALQAVDAVLNGGEWAAFLGELDERAHETERLVASWRKQRLEKMENRVSATFPAFHAAAVERFAAWESWVTEAETKQRRLFEDILPQARMASSNVTEWASAVKREHGRLEDSIARLRATPVDEGLVSQVRKEALDAFDVKIRKAVEAMAKWTPAEEGFPETARRRCVECGRKAEALDADVKRFSDMHGQYLSASSKQGATAAVKQTRDSKEKSLADITVFELGMAELHSEGKGVADAVTTAKMAADAIRAMAQVDEVLLTANLAEIEAVRLQIEKSRATARRKELDDRRKGVESSLAAVETALARAEKDFATAKTKALGDEKTAKWEAEKNTLKAELVHVRTLLERKPAPGYARPEGEARSLKTTVENLLSRIDSIRDDTLRAAVQKATSDAKSIENRTKWTPGTRHPTKPHIFAMEKENVWDADPGYWFDHPGENSDLVVRWRPGRRHPNHPHISAGQTEGSWIPDPGYKARWNGDLDPVWTTGTRHPTRPHIFASRENGKDVWACDPGYVWVQPNSHNLDCYWSSGLRHPDHEGIESAQQEGRWITLPGWAFVNPGTSDLRTRWVPGARFPGKPHIHAGAEKWKWSADEGYDFNQYNSNDLSVHWSPGKVSANGQRRAGRREGQFETKRKCPYCVNGYTEKWGTCEVCNGSGKITAFGHTVPCIPCIGTGRSQTKRPCQRCDGVGWTWQ